MKQSSTISATGKVFVTLLDNQGKIKEKREIENLVVTVGREFIVARMAGIPNIMSHIGVGESSTPTIAGHTELLSPIGSRAELDEPAVVLGTTISYKSTFLPGNGTGELAEAGIFDSLTEGIMLARTTFAVVNKAPDDSLTIQWNITIN